MPAWFFAPLMTIGSRGCYLGRGPYVGRHRHSWTVSDRAAGGNAPEIRLYAVAAGSLAFAAFGANGVMSIAADSTIARFSPVRWRTLWSRLKPDELGHVKHAATYASPRRAARRPSAGALSNRSKKGP
jgi:hypothetical protein